MTCRVCGRALEPCGTGRPPAYCGSRCRRSAEHAVRRLRRQLALVVNDIESLEARSHASAVARVAELRTEYAALAEKLTAAGSAPYPSRRER
jgi:hypothetical protein